MTAKDPPPHLTEQTLRNLIHRPEHGVSDDAQLQELCGGSGISVDVLRESRIWTVRVEQDLSVLAGIHHLAPDERDRYLPALAFPYYLPDAPDKIVSVRVKTRTPFRRKDDAESAGAKYLSRRGSAPQLYFSPRLLRSETARKDAQILALMCEGEKKALAADSAGFHAVGLAGCEAWHLHRSKDLLPDFRHLTLAGRVVLVAFDGDVATNPNVARALNKLLSALRESRAKAGVLRFPAGDTGKIGLDDYLVRYGAEALHKLVAEAANRACNPVVSVTLADVAPEEVRWLWARYIPLGKLTVLDGDPGRGKSTLLAWLAAQVTRGAALSETPLDRPRGVVLMTAEDGLADTARPRIEAAGGDPARVRVLQAVHTDDADRPIEIPTDVADIAEHVARTDAALVIIDPLPAHLGGEVDSHRDQQVRRALAPLAQMAETTGAAVVVVRHLNKMPGTSALYRGGGSIGITGAARSVLLLAEDPEDPQRRILAVSKASLTPTPRSRRLALVPSENVPGVAHVQLMEECDLTADDLLRESPTGGSDGRAPRRLDSAMEALRELLGRGPMAAGEVRRAMGEQGHREATVDRAARQIGVVKHGGTWSLEQGGEHDPAASSAPASEVGTARPHDVISADAHPWAGLLPTLEDPS